MIIVIGKQKTVVEKMNAMGILGDLPESNQISVVDIMN